MARKALLVGVEFQRFMRLARAFGLEI